MRQMIVKKTPGAYRQNKADVSLCVNKAGSNRNGSPRRSVVIRFHNGSHVKVCQSGYICPVIDWSSFKLYFASTNNEVGFKLSGRGKSKYFTFSDHENIHAWEFYAGDYDLVRGDKNDEWFINLLNPVK